MVLFVINTLSVMPLLIRVYCKRTHISSQRDLGLNSSSLPAVWQQASHLMALKLLYRMWMTFTPYGYCTVRNRWTILYVKFLGMCMAPCRGSFNVHFFPFLPSPWMKHANITFFSFFSLILNQGYVLLILEREERREGGEEEREKHRCEREI